jgi:TolB-like protein
MTETLINSLSRLPDLSVKARSSVFRYKVKELDPKKIASELNVQAILTGRIIRRGDQMTLNLELIDAQTENTLWGNRNERTSSELVALQSEIARDVSDKGVMT